MVQRLWPLGKLHFCPWGIGDMGEVDYPRSLGGGMRGENTGHSAPYSPDVYILLHIWPLETSSEKNNPFSSYCSLWGKYNFPSKGTWFYLHDIRGRTQRDKLPEGLGKPTFPPKDSSALERLKNISKCCVLGCWIARITPAFKPYLLALPK